jgi:hypothetical protein
MKLSERVILLVALATSCSFSIGLLVSKSIVAQGKTISISRLEIIDAAGRPRIVMTTDADGGAKLQFIQPDRKTQSIIQQFRDGSMTLSFAGKGVQPAVNLSTDLLNYGPILTMRGNGKEQTILLGFPEDDAMKPAQASKTWGLFFPDRRPFQYLAGIGAAEAINSSERRGFVFPRKQ